MSLLDIAKNAITGAVDFFTGGVGTKIVKEISGIFKENDIPPEQKRIFDLKALEIGHKYDLQQQEFLLKTEQAFNQRIKDMEGTANDLKSIPYIGAIVIFLRGLQRPLWGFFTFYADWKIFASEWTLPDERLYTLLLVINILILAFLFGERAIKNVMPLISQYLGKGVKNG